MHGWRRRAVTAAVALAVAAPTVLDDGDGFPFSTYPMFSTDRGTQVAVGTAVAVDADGTVDRLDPSAIGGGDEVMLAATTVRRAIGAGPEATSRLCAEIADRVAADATGGAIEIRTERHDSVAWFDGDREPLDVVVHARCPVVAR